MGSKVPTFPNGVCQLPCSSDTREILSPGTIDHFAPSLTPARGGSDMVEGSHDDSATLFLDLSPSQRYSESGGHGFMCGWRAWSEPDRGSQQAGPEGPRN